MLPWSSSSPLRNGFEPAAPSPTAFQAAGKTQPIMRAEPCRPRIGHFVPGHLRQPGRTPRRVAAVHRHSLRVLWRVRADLSPGRPHALRRPLPQVPAHSARAGRQGRHDRTPFQGHVTGKTPGRTSRLGSRQQPDDFRILREPASLVLAINELAVHLHIENSARPLNQLRFDAARLLDRGRQTGSPGQVVSLCAICNADLHEQHSAYRFQHQSQEDDRGLLPSRQRAAHPVTRGTASSPDK